MKILISIKKIARVFGASLLVGAAFSSQSFATNSVGLTCAGIGSNYV